MAIRGSGNWCAAINCQNSRKKGYRLFSFPLEEERCKVWVQNCRRKDLLGQSPSYLHANCCICAEHFEASQFMNPSNPKCRLIWCAVPTLFDVPNPPPMLTTKRKLPTRNQLPAKKPRKHKQTQSSNTGAQCVTVTTDMESYLPVLPSSVPLPGPSTVLQTATDKESQSTPPSSSVAVSSQLKELSPQKTALKLKVKTLQQKCRRWKMKPSSNKKRLEMTPESTDDTEKKKCRLIKELKQFLPPSTMTFVATQIRLAGRKRTGNRWTPEEKSLALSLVHTSPKAYRILRKILNLPSVSTLKRAMQNVRIYPGFNSNILQALKKKVSSMPAGGKVCAVVFDEMTIKEELSYNPEEDNIEGLEDFGNHRTIHAANHATVFMVRGLLQPWKQAIGYFFSSGPVNGNLLKSLLSQCIEKITEIGLDVKAVVCDQGSNNRKALEGLGVNEDKPYFIHQENKIYVIYDPPHLLKNTRNNMKKTGFVKNNTTIDWGYIIQFFNLDSRNSVRMAPKLSHKHIKLPGFSALRVKFATQVLSHSVAAGISTMVTLHALPEEATETALFVERMDQLFNAFNSHSKRSSQKMRHAISETSGHRKFFEETLIWLSTLQSKSTRRLPCLIGWKISIRSLLLLWDDLRNTHEATFLCTSRLNQDCIENLFSVIRGKGGHRDNPGPKQFRLSLRQTMVESILLKSPSSNCTDDGDHFLLTLNNMTAHRDHTIDQAQETPAEHQIPESSLIDSTFAMPEWDLNMQEENILTYIAGYIARKVKGKVCTECMKVLVGDLEGTQQETLLITKQLPDLQEPGLVIPSTQLVHVVQQLEIVFKNSGQLLHMNRVRTRFLMRLDKEGSALMCPSQKCKLRSLVVNLFLNIRLHFTITDNNRKFAAASGRQNRKMLKLQHV